MAKRKIAQFRYFGDSNGYLNSTVAGTIYHKMDNNQPASLTSIDLQSGDAFLDYVPIVQLGVQALPGTRFNLNANIDSNSSVIYDIEFKANETSNVQVDVEIQEK